MGELHDKVEGNLKAGIGDATGDHRMQTEGELQKTKGGVEEAGRKVGGAAEEMAGKATGNPAEEIAGREKRA
ncbi:MAG: CsbD family protein [Candidatus Dormibacteria bacterium]